MLTASGERLAARRLGRDGLAAAGTIGAALDALVAAHLGMIRTEFGRFTRQVSGYSLEHLLPENGADLAKFLVGTEGTLGMVLGATVRLVQSPKAVALAVLGYPGMPEAADAVPACCRTARWRSRAWTRGWWRSSGPAGVPRPCPGCRAVRPGCSWRPPAIPRPRRARRPSG